MRRYEVRVSLFVTDEQLRMVGGSLAETDAFGATVYVRDLLAKAEHSLPDGWPVGKDVIGSRQLLAVDLVEEV